MGFLDNLELPVLNLQRKPGAETAHQPAIRTCERCSGPMPKGARKKIRFCGRRCAASYRADKTRKTHVVCICGKTAPTPGHRSCSKQCGYLSRKLRRMKPLTCRVCSRQYWPKGAVLLKYCSKRCYDVKRAEGWVRVEIMCEGCNKPFTRPKAKIRHGKKSFCSHACFANWNIGSNNGGFRGSIGSARGPGWPRLAKTVRALDGYRCRRCGKTQHENKRGLEVDHIIPWRCFTDKVAANDIANLASLCARCHRQKTVIENKWFRGDCIDMDRYIAVVRRAS